MEISLRKRNTVLLFFVILFCTAAHAADQGTVSVPPINAPATSQQISGKIIWHDLVTINVKTSQQFYKELFGWQFKAFVSGKDTYIYISRNGKAIGGIVPLSKQEAAKNENQWVSYISVADVAQATQFVKKNGGKVLLEPQKFEQQGELAVFTDPEGAVFGVLKSASGDPVDGRIQAGQWGWADLMVKNPQQAIKFYRGIANYGVKKYRRDQNTNDYYLISNKLARAGVAAIPGGKQAPQILPNWLPYIIVSNINAAVVKTTKLGGRVILKPASQVYHGRLAVIADPGGAALGLIEIKNAKKN